MKLRIAFTGLLLIVLFSACYYDNEEELYETTECLVEGVTYSQDVLPIIQNECYGCHDAATRNAGVNLEGYDKLKIYADNEFLLGVIRHESNFSPMPQNAPQLLDCEIAKIEEWIKQGAENN